MELDSKSNAYNASIIPALLPNQYSHAKANENPASSSLSYSVPDAIFAMLCILNDALDLYDVKMMETK
jgi:hypothetical protein